MVVLDRDERRRRVLELHNQNMGTREIAELLRMSFTDISKILKNADKRKKQNNNVHDRNISPRGPTNYFLKERVQ